MLKNDIWLSRACKINCFNVNKPYFYKEKFKIKKNFLITCKIPKKKQKNNRIKRNVSSLRLIGENVIFKKKINTSQIKLNSQINLINSKKNEKKKLINLCMQNMRTSRFDLDLKIPRRKVKNIRQKWISSYFLNLRNKIIFSVYTKKKLIGLLCIIIKKNNLIIDLIALKKKETGQNFGKSIINNLELKFPKFKHIIVGTYKENKGAMSFYKKNHFKIIKNYLVYHYYEK